MEGKDTSATIDTKGVAGGNYTVTAHVTDPKMKKNGDATCTANYTVKEPPKNPPTMSCSANPTIVQTGVPSTITCTCTSPDGVPVTVAGWTATGGKFQAGQQRDPEHHGRCARPDYSQRNLHRFAWFDGELLVPSDRGEPASSAAARPAS